MHCFHSLVPACSIFLQYECDLHIHWFCDGKLNVSTSLCGHVIHVNLVTGNNWRCCLVWWVPWNILAVVNLSLSYFGDWKIRIVIIMTSAKSCFRFVSLSSLFRRKWRYQVLSTLVEVRVEANFLSTMVEIVNCVEWLGPKYSSLTPFRPGPAVHLTSHLFWNDMIWWDIYKMCWIEYHGQWSYSRVRL